MNTLMTKMPNKLPLGHTPSSLLLSRTSLLNQTRAMALFHHLSYPVAGITHLHQIVLGPPHIRQYPSPPPASATTLAQVMYGSHSMRCPFFLTLRRPVTRIKGRGRENIGIGQNQDARWMFLTSPRYQYLRVLLTREVV